MRTKQWKWTKRNDFSIYEHMANKKIPKKTKSKLVNACHTFMIDIWFEFFDIFFFCCCVFLLLFSFESVGIDFMDSNHSEDITENNTHAYARSIMWIENETFMKYEKKNTDCSAYNLIGIFKVVNDGYLFWLLVFLFCLFIC